VNARSAAAKREEMRRELRWTRSAFDRVGQHDGGPRVARARAKLAVRFNLIQKPTQAGPVRNLAPSSKVDVGKHCHENAGVADCPGPHGVLRFRSGIRRSRVSPAAWRLEHAAPACVEPGSPRVLERGWLETRMTGLSAGSHERGERYAVQTEEPRTGAFAHGLLPMYGQIERRVSLDGREQNEKK
jgi:hypothetical protein